MAAKVVTGVLKELDNKLFDLLGYVTCSVCHELVKDPVTTTCGHTYCQNCLKRALSVKNGTCPLCKNPLNRRELQKDEARSTLSKILLDLPRAFKEDVVDLGSDLKISFEDYITSSALCQMSPDDNIKVGRGKRSKKLKPVTAATVPVKDNADSFVPVVRHEKNIIQYQNKKKADELISVSQVDVNSGVNIVLSMNTEKKLNAIETLPTSDKIAHWFDVVGDDILNSSEKSIFGEVPEAVNPAPPEEPIIVEVKNQTMVRVDYRKERSSKTVENIKPPTDSADSGDPYEFIPSQHSNVPKKKRRKPNAKKKPPDFHALQRFSKENVKRNAIVVNQSSENDSDRVDELICADNNDKAFNNRVSDLIQEPTASQKFEELLTERPKPEPQQRRHTLYSPTQAKSESLACSYVSDPPIISLQLKEKTKAQKRKKSPAYEPEDDCLTRLFMSPQKGEEAVGKRENPNKKKKISNLSRISKRRKTTGDIAERNLKPLARYSVGNKTEAESSPKKTKLVELLEEMLVDSNLYRDENRTKDEEEEEFEIDDSTEPKLPIDVNKSMANASVVSRSPGWSRVSGLRSDFQTVKRQSRKSLNVSGGEQTSNTSKNNSRNNSINKDEVEEPLFENRVENLSQSSDLLIGFSQVENPLDESFKRMVENMEHELDSSSFSSKSPVNKVIERRRSSVEECVVEPLIQNQVLSPVKMNPESESPSVILGTEEHVFKKPEKKVPQRKASTKRSPLTVVGKIKKRKNSSVVLLQLGRLAPLLRKSRSTVVKLVLPNHGCVLRKAPTSLATAEVPCQNHSQPGAASTSIGVQTSQRPVEKITTSMQTSSSPMKRTVTSMQAPASPIKKVNTSMQTSPGPVKMVTTSMQSSQSPIKRVVTSKHASFSPIKKVTTSMQTSQILTEKVSTSMQTSQIPIEKTTSSMQTSQRMAQSASVQTSQTITASAAVQTTQIRRVASEGVQTSQVMSEPVGVQTSQIEKTLSELPKPRGLINEPGRSTSSSDFIPLSSNGKLSYRNLKKEKSVTNEDFVWTECPALADIDSQLMVAANSSPVKEVNALQTIEEKPEEESLALNTQLKYEFDQTWDEKSSPKTSKPRGSKSQKRKSTQSRISSYLSVKSSDSDDNKPSERDEDIINTSKMLKRSGRILSADLSSEKETSQCDTYRSRQFLPLDVRKSLVEEEERATTVDLITQETNSQEDIDSQELLQRVFKNIDMDLNRAKGKPDTEMSEDEDSDAKKNPNKCQNSEESDSDMFVEQTPPKPRRSSILSLSSHNSSVEKKQLPKPEEKVSEVFPVNSEGTDIIACTVPDPPPPPPPKNKKTKKEVKSPEPEEAKEESFLILSASENAIASPVRPEKPETKKDNPVEKPFKVPNEFPNKKSFFNDPKEPSPNENDQNRVNFNESKRKTVPEAVFKPAANYPRKLCIAASSAINLEGINNFVNKFKLEYSSKPVRHMTHLVVGLHENDDGERLPFCTPKFLYAMANHKWIVTENWVETCLKLNTIVPEEPFESLDPGGGTGCKIARLSTEPLLKDFEVYLLGDFELISKEEFSDLIMDCGGTLVQQPDKFSYLPGKIRIIVADRDSLEEDETQVQALFEKHKTAVLSRDVIINSIQNYKLVNFTSYLLTLTSESELVKLGYPYHLVKHEEDSEWSCTK